MTEPRTQDALNEPDRPRRRAGSGTPRWVKAFIVAGAVVAVAFLALHLLGGGMGHMGMGGH